jgi:hypothetical protein
MAQNHAPNHRILLVYAATGALCCWLALAWFLAVPSEAGSAALMGYSCKRLGAALLPAAMGVGYLYLAIKVARDSADQKVSNQLQGFLQQEDNALWLWIIALLGCILGVIFLVMGLPVFDGPFYPLRLLPLVVWLLALSLINLLFFPFFSGSSRIPRVSHVLVLLVILLGCTLVSFELWNFSTALDADIFSVFTEGDRLLQRENPYERVLIGDMRENDKYATYFPIFYYLSWWSHSAGLREFTAWLSVWRVMFLIFNLLIACLLFYLPERDGLFILAVLAAVFWSFNRWTLHVTRTFDIDFPPVFFMLLSLALFKRNWLISSLLLGLSLGIKQMGIFLVPLYLIWAWQESSTQKLRRLFFTFLAISSIPLITSLPFLAWNAEGFIKSIAFSATRDPAAAFRAFSLDTLLGVNGIPGKLLMLALLGLVYWLAWKWSAGRYLAALLVLAVFVFFNSVLFTSYLVWLVPLIPLTAYQYLSQHTHQLAGG